jgi:hypothetical protein
MEENSNEFLKNALVNVEESYNTMKSLYDIDANTQKSLTLVIKSLKELSKNYKENELLFDYLYGVFISISLGPELVGRQIEFIFDSIQASIEEADGNHLNLFDENGKRVSLEELGLNKEQ